MQGVGGWVVLTAGVKTLSMAERRGGEFVLPQPKHTPGGLTRPPPPRRGGSDFGIFQENLCVEITFYTGIFPISVLFQANLPSKS